MALKNNLPSRKVVLKSIFSGLLFLFFENVCWGGQWTMMFYMAADNDLYSQALIDIKELQRISGRPGIDIIVQLDSPSGAYRYRVLPQGTSILASLGQSNSGSPEALADFGSWAVKMYPAQKYLLVLWDHGDGWSKQGKSIGYDQYFKDWLSVAGGELRQAVAKISATAGQPLDVVVFDACSMQMAEVLMELNGLCQYAVGSEALFPVEGMPYDAAWKSIDGNTSAESLAVKLVNSCSIFNDLGYQATCSAVNIGILSAASQSLKSLTGRLRQLPISVYVNTGAISDSVLSFPPFASYDLPGMLDFIGARLPEPEKIMVLTASRQFKNSVMVQFIAGNDYQKANGLAAWYPNGKYNFEGGIDLYSNLKWSGLSGWDKLLYHLIFQQDSTAPVPQKINLIQGSDGVRRLTWEPGYEPSGIESYQIRHSQNLITTFSDQAGTIDSSGWIKTGFTITVGDSRDTAYYSIGGQMTGKNAIQFDSSGNIGFTAEGIWGSLILESSADTFLEWDTLGIWNYYGEDQKKYCSSKIKSTAATIRISWNPFSSSLPSWVYIDDIKVSHPDASKEIETVNTSLLSHNLSNRPGSAGFYQARTVDSLQNQSSWSDAVFYRPESGFARVWPNPFKDKIFLLFSSSTGRSQDIKIFNILGQYVDKMTLKKREINGGTAENLFYWKPKASIAEGIYIAQLNSDTGVRAVKMILIR